MASSFKPRWFHFTLQGMLVIVALLAIGLAFFGTKIKRARDEQKIVQVILASGGQVHSTYFGMYASPGGPKETWFERLIDLDLETRATGVTIAGARGQPVTDDDVAPLAGLEELQSLDIRAAQVTGEAFEKLKGLQHLKYITLYQSGLTDDGLRRLGSLQGLENLGLFHERRITDAGLDGFLRCRPNLHMLTIDACPITGAALKSLGACRTLTYLHLDPAGDDQIARIGTLKSLEVLHLRGNITDKSLSLVGNLATLKYLHVQGDEITDAGIEHLVGLQSLNDLTIESTRGAITDAGVEHIVKLKRLKVLQTSGTAISPEGAERLKRELPGITLR